MTAKIKSTNTEERKTINKDVRSFFITFSNEIMSHTARREITVKAKTIAISV